MSLQNLANQMQATGRGGDTMLVHMNPKEVAGLQQLAMAHGGSLTTNPETGLPEAGFLTNLLPTVIGLALAPATGGASLGLTSAFQTAAIVGAGAGLMTGSLKKGLMAGLGAFGGASMAPGIMGASTAAAVPTASMVGNPAFTPGTGAFAQVAGGPSLATLNGVNPALPSLGTAQNLGLANQNAALAPVTNTAQNMGRLYQGVGIPPSTAPAVAQTVGSVGGPPSVLDNFGSGLKNIFTNQGGAGSRFVDENKMNMLASLGSALMTPQDVEEEKKKKEAELERYVYNPRFSPSPRIANSTAERTYFAAGGGMVPSPAALRDSSIQGTVEQMSQMNAVGDNTRYPMASQTTPTYALPAERPISQNVVYPATDSAVGAYTGMPSTNMAGGGITALAAGGMSKQDIQKQIDEIKAKPRGTAMGAKIYSDEQNKQIRNLEAQLKTASAKATPTGLAATTAGTAAAEQAAQPTRTGTGITARGAYSTTAGDVDALKKQIQDIRKNPEGTGSMGARYLTDDQEKEIKDLESKVAGMSAAAKEYNPATGQYEVKQEGKFKKLTTTPTYGTTKQILEEKDVRQMFDEVAGRSPTEQELGTYIGKKLSENELFNKINALSEVGAAKQFTNDDLNAQAKYYWGRDMTGGELAYYKDPANKITNFKTLRTAMTSAPAYLQNLNVVNEAAFNAAQTATKAAAIKPASITEIISLYNDTLGRPATKDEVKALRAAKKSTEQIAADLEGSEEYLDYATKPFVPTVDKKDVTTTGGAQPGDLTINKPVVPPISQAQINAYRQDYNAPSAGLGAYQGPSSQLFDTTGQGGYVFNPPQQVASVEGALPYMDVMQRLGINNVYKQIADKALPLENTLNFGAPKDYDPFGSGDPFGSYAAGGMAVGGMAEGGYNLGGYSDGGRLLKGPGDGVSDSIPATIGRRQPARLADGEFVIPARIVSELGNGSTEAGARQLYAMMDRVQKKRRGTVGKGKIAVNSKAARMLPA